MAVVDQHQDGLLLAGRRQQLEQRGSHRRYRRRRSGARVAQCRDHCLRKGGAVGSRAQFAVVFEGVAGIGKSSLWAESVRRAEAAGHLVLSCRAAQSEVRLAFAALTDLLIAIPCEHIDSLPAPQSSALNAALLRAPSAAPPDPRTIGMAVTSLFAREAEQRGIVVAIDDLQWIDRSSMRALEFALRRLATSPVTVIGTSRPTDSQPFLDAATSWTDVHRVALRPATVAALDAIVSPLVSGVLTRSAVKRLWTASSGNPFVVLEMVRSLHGNANEIELLECLVPQSVRDTVEARLGDLPNYIRDELLLLATAGPGTSAPVDLATLAPALGRGLIVETPDGRVEFAHPLYQSAVLGVASAESRRRAHRRLASTAGDPDAMARHLALAEDGVSEDAADALEAAGDRALLRGALDEAAEFFELSAERTPADEFETAPARLLRSAEVRLAIFDSAEARRLVAAVLDTNPSSELVAQAHLVEAETLILFDPGQVRKLLEVSLPLATSGRTRVKLLVSLGAVHMYFLDFLKGNELLSEAIDLAKGLGLDELLAQAIANRELANLSLGRGFDAGELDLALSLEDPAGRCYFQSRPSLAGARVFEFTGQHLRARALLESTAGKLRELGEELEMSFVLSHLAATSMISGDLDQADREATSALELATQSDQLAVSSLALSIRAVVAAMRGDGERALSDGAKSIEIAAASGWPWSEAMVRWARALVALAEDDHRRARQELDDVVTAVERFGVFEIPLTSPLPDAIEALVATGDLAWASRLAARLEEWGHRFDRQWARAVALRGQSLIASAQGRSDDAMRLGEAAIAEHEGLPMAWDLGRALLAVGQVRRRAGERRAAREALEAAIAIFDRIGAVPWAEKARAELARIGVRRAPEALTENERRVCELAAAGVSNPTIASRLFMSVRTVEANLSRAYRKLSITSRAQLGVALAKAGADSGH